MKKLVLLIAVIVQFLLSTELYQLLKLPVFIAHYHEHRLENNALSLGQFLWIHYLQGDVKDADYDRDMQLPFKTCDCRAFHFLVLFPGTRSIVLQPGVEFIDVFYPRSNHHLALSSHLADIWQPPRQTA